jgi:hypothetical protein
VVDK